MKVIYFDCFGVLSSPVYTKLFNTYITDESERQTWINKLVDLDLGTLSEAEIVHQLSEQTQISEQELWQAVKDAPVLNQELFNYIQDKLKDNYTLGLLTNIGPELLDKVIPINLQGLFAIQLISSELGLVKPDPKIFQIAIERANVPASEILFIDDRLENIKGAKTAGIQGIVYTDISTLKEDLANYL